MLNYIHGHLTDEKKNWSKKDFTFVKIIGVYFYPVTGSPEYSHFSLWALVRHHSGFLYAHQCQTDKRCPLVTSGTEDGSVLILPLVIPYLSTSLMQLIPL